MFIGVLFDFFFFFLQIVICNARVATRAVRSVCFSVPQPDAETAGLPLGGVRGRHAGAGVPHRGVHRVAHAVLCRHHLGVLLGAAGRAVHTVRDHRAAPDGQLGNRGAQHEPRGAPVPPAGGAHAGHRGRVVFPVPAAVPRAHPVDHPGAARLQHHGAGRRREVLPAAVLLPHHAVHQLGAEPHPVQPDVVQVPRRVPPAVRPAPRPVARPAPGPQGHGDHDVGARGRHRHHHHHHRRHRVQRQRTVGRRRCSDLSEQRRTGGRGHCEHVHQDEAKRYQRDIVGGASRRGRRPHQAAEHDRGRGHAEAATPAARELRLNPAAIGRHFGGGPRA